MRRPPIFATLVVVAAVATMIALGIWQLRRAEWKEALLAQYAAAASLPALDLDPFVSTGREPPPLTFRRVLVTCHARDAAPDLRGGRRRNAGEGDAGGYSYFIPCRPGETGLAGRLVVNMGWLPLPDDSLRLSADGIVAGTLGSDEPGRPLILTSANPAPGLGPSAAPTIDQIPNNHRFYAAQWFFFALAASVIYVLALRRRRRE